MDFFWPSMTMEQMFAVKPSGGIAAEVHDRTGAESHNDIRLIQLFHHVLDQALFGEQPLRFQNDLLVGLHMLAFRELVNHGVIDHRSPAGEAELFHIFLKMVQSAVVNNDFPGLEGMGPAAAAGAGVLRTVHDHSPTCLL